MEQPDPKVLAAARDGDLDAFEELVRRYQGEAWRLAFHLLRDEESASDVTQEAFVRAYRSLARFRGEARFTTWMFSIVRNCAIDELRRRSRRERVTREATAIPPATSDQTVGVEVREALASLPLELREPVVLIDMFGSSYREVAQLLSVPEGTVKSRVHRARAQLARSLLLRGVIENG